MTTAQKTNTVRVPHLCWELCSVLLAVGRNYFSNYKLNAKTRACF